MWRRGEQKGGAVSEKKRERKKKSTSVRLAFVSGRRVQRVHVKNGGQPPPLAFASERGSQTPAEKRERVSTKGGKKKKKKTEPSKTSQTLNREEGASEREARKKTRPKA